MNVVVLSVLVFARTTAFPFIDPMEIGADELGMLNPAHAYSLCNEEMLIISVDPIEKMNQISAVMGKKAQHSVAKEPSSERVACSLGDLSVIADISMNPPGERGMCAATNGISVTIDVNGQRVLYTDAADYCRENGFTSIAFMRPHAKHDLTLRLCGYWEYDVAVERGLPIARRTFECSKFDARELLRNKYYVKQNPQWIERL